MGIPWDAATAHRIITNKRYCEQLLFNQTTRRMCSKAAPSPKDQWIRCDDALEPMVSRFSFELVRKIREERAVGPTREAVLERLRALAGRAFTRG